MRLTLLTEFLETRVEIIKIRLFLLNVTGFLSLFATKGSFHNQLVTLHIAICIALLTLRINIVSHRISL